MMLLRTRDDTTEVWGLLACFLPGLAHLALLYGAEEQKRTRKTRITIREAWNAYMNQFVKEKEEMRKDEDSTSRREVEGQGILV